MTIGRIALDTSAYIKLRRGHVEILNWMASAEVVEVSTVALGELEAGFLLGSRYAENLRVLEDFLEEPFVGVRTVTRDVSRHYGRILRGLREAGTPIPTNDIWIAAAAADSGAHLVTFDRDFAKIPDLAHTVLVE